MQTHTIEGERMLQRVGGFLDEVGRIVRASHERWDGSGYPDGLRGEEIPIEARSCQLLRRVQRDDDDPVLPHGALHRRGTRGGAPQRRHPVRPAVADVLVGLIEEGAAHEVRQTTLLP